MEPQKPEELLKPGSREMIRYTLEHILLPQELYGERAKILLLMLMKEQGNLLKELLDKIREEQECASPYRAEDFVFRPHVFRDHDGKLVFVINEIVMPEPEKMPLCSRIFICHDKVLEHIWYCTVEKSVDDTEVLCSWSLNAHLNHGEAPETPEEIFRKVLEMYRRSLGIAPDEIDFQEE